MRSSGRLCEEALALQRLGKLDEAATLFQEALSVDQASVPALVASSFIAQTRGRLDEAERFLACAVTLHPNEPIVRVCAATLAAARLDDRAARRHTRAALRASDAIVRMNDPSEKPTVVVLTGYGGGTFSLDEHAFPVLVHGHSNLLRAMDRRPYDVVLVNVEFAESSDVADLLRRASAIVNVMADPDQLRHSLSLASRLLRHGSAPVVNHPDTVLRVGRDRLARALAGIEGVVVPSCTRFQWRKSESSFRRVLIEAMERARMSLPCLVRPVGSHGGHGLVRIEALDDLDRWQDGGATTRATAEAFYLTQFVDIRRQDGCYRKTRVYGIGGKVSPEHHLVARGWNVHSGTARREMDDHPWMRHEERQALRDFGTVGQGRVRRILEEVVRRLDLDVIAIDYAEHEGSVVLFEANPVTSLIQPTELATEGEYLAPYVEGIARDLDTVIAGRVGA